VHANNVCVCVRAVTAQNRRSKFAPLGAPSAMCVCVCVSACVQVLIFGGTNDVGRGLDPDRVMEILTAMYKVRITDSENVDCHLYSKHKGQDMSKHKGRDMSKHKGRDMSKHKGRDMSNRAHILHTHMGCLTRSYAGMRCR
jgi:hypothetical protein